MELNDISITISEFSRVLHKFGTMHIIVVHPLFQLFVINSEKVNESNSILRKYSKPQRLKVKI